MPETAEKKQALVLRISAYIDSHLSEKITLVQVAQHCGVSVSTITQTFQQLGTTFHQLLTRRRMEAALELIRSGMPLEKTGRAVGYSDHSSFFRAFRLYYGASPRKYRQENLSHTETA